MLKGLPLAYNKDMQEDKEAAFDAMDTLQASLVVVDGMLSSMRVNSERMLDAAHGGFMAATDLADYLVGKGIAVPGGARGRGTHRSRSRAARSHAAGPLGR